LRLQGLIGALASGIEEESAASFLEGSLTQSSYREEYDPLVTEWLLPLLYIREVKGTSGLLARQVEAFVENCDNANIIGTRAIYLNATNIALGSIKVCKDRHKTIEILDQLVLEAFRAGRLETANALLVRRIALQGLSPEDLSPTIVTLFLNAGRVPEAVDAMRKLRVRWQSTKPTTIPPGLTSLISKLRSVGQGALASDVAMPFAVEIENSVRTPRANEVVTFPGNTRKKAQ
jgi:hypothetical protein